MPVLERLRPLAITFFCGLGSFLAACGSGNTDTGVESAPSAVATEHEENGACSDEDEIALTRSPSTGHPSALYVPVEVAGSWGLLHLDSASARTVLFAPEASGWIEEYRWASLGCHERILPGVSGLGSMPDVDGQPVLGMAGADLLLEEPVLLDVARGILLRSPRDPSVAAGTLDVPHTIALGLYVVEATFDGAPVRLILDTGAGHTLWLSDRARPGEVDVVTQDALGQPLVLRQSTVTLGLGGASKQVPLVRTAKFGIVEELSKKMGIQLDGLVGLSALRMVWADSASGVLRVAM